MRYMGRGAVIRDLSLTLSLSSGYPRCDKLLIKTPHSTMHRATRSHAQSTGNGVQPADPLHKSGSTHDPDAPDGASGSTRPESWGELCLADCLHEGHYKEDEMLRCCACASFMHIDCISRTEKCVKGIWTCFECRLMPSYVAELRKNVSDLTVLINNLTYAVSSLQQQNSQSAEVQQKLQTENADLRQRISDMAAESSAEKWQQFPKAHGTVLLGSIRDVDEQKLVATKCICIRGGVIRDMQSQLDSFPDNERLQRIVIVAGGNDCDDLEPQTTVEDLAKQYHDLIEMAKSLAVTVTVSSICPREKGPEVTERIQALNAAVR